MKATIPIAREAAIEHRILTTRFERRHPHWRARTDLLPGWNVGYRQTLGGGAASPAATLYWGGRLFRESAGYRAVVTGSEPVAHVFALLLSLSGRRTPLVMIECMWNIGHRALWPLRRAERRLEARAITRAVLFAERQRSRFAATWGLRRHTVVAIPYHLTLDDLTFECRDEGFIFAGGDTARDYRTLIEATRHLGVPVVIAALRRDHFRGVDVPPHVTILTASPQEFVQLMAAAHVVVVPLQGGLLYSGGHQTYLNAMAMGKPVVVADDGGAEEYVTQGETGFVVAPGDVAALRESLAFLLDHPGEVKAIGERAAAAASAYTPERFFDNIYRLVDEAIGGVE